MEAQLQSLAMTEESLQLRLELIEQMESEYLDEKRDLQSKIQELMNIFMNNGGHYWAESSPLLCKVISELKAEADSSEEEAELSDEEEEAASAEEQRELDVKEEHLDDEEDKLVIVTDDEAEEETEASHINVEEGANGSLNGKDATRTEEMDVEAAGDDDSDLPYVVLGPNGTTVDRSGFRQVIWTTVATATRSLLTLVFSDDILATHTLTGKPSPAFHGRERPPKKQLDPLKTADIVHCIVARCKGANERQVRSSITSKCADTAKKYKRRDSRGSAEH